MGMNDTPSGERVHIGFFGRRNSGKSSLVNAVTGQEVSLVSDTLGTTTDPVSKAMEILPLGPVVIIDTPGFDDTGKLGEQRVRRTKQVLNRADVAVLVIDAVAGMQECDRQLVALFRDKEIPYLIAANKCDLLRDQNVPENQPAELAEDPVVTADAGNTAGTDLSDIIYVSALYGTNVYELKERIAALSGRRQKERRLVGDLLNPGDLVVLVIPIDSSAPKGRLILPQQQVIRDVLEAGAAAICVRDTEYAQVMAAFGCQKSTAGSRSAADPQAMETSAAAPPAADPQTMETPAAAPPAPDSQLRPALVITDSQVFGRVAADTPEDVPLTSFSILMARYKGFLEMAVRGVAHIDSLKDGDRILIAEGCTHHRQCEDIGTVKLPRWLREFTGRDFVFETCSGRDFPEDLSRYALVLHCGGCMLTERELLYRMKCAADCGVPVTNYGTAIARMRGILKRSLAPFPEFSGILKRSLAPFPEVK